MSRKVEEWLYLCTQMGCKHWLDEFAILVKEKPCGYIPCPACGCSAEWNGFYDGTRLKDRIIING